MIDVVERCSYDTTVRGGIVLTRNGNCRLVVVSVSKYCHTHRHVDDMTAQQSSPNEMITGDAVYDCVIHTPSY